MKRLIVNADDLGLSVAVSRGIEKGFREGLVTSATLMANMPGFEEGVRVSRDNPELGIGVHLNLIRGLPLSPADEVAPLLGPGGTFINSFYHIGRVSANKDYIAAAEREYRAQIEKVLDAGIKPDHIDFEKHHGIWRNLYNLADRLAGEYGLGIRSYYEPFFFVWQNLPSPGLGAMWKSLHLFTYQFFRHKRPKAFSPDYFFGQSHIGKLDRDFLRQLLYNLPEGTSELMCHPGLRDGEEEEGVSEAVGDSWITGCRINDLAALADPEINILAGNLDIKLGTFAEFSEEKSND